MICEQMTRYILTIFSSLNCTQFLKFQLLFFIIGAQFQVLIWNTNSSICTRLNGFDYSYSTFAIRMIKDFYLI